MVLSSMTLAQVVQILFNRLLLIRKRTLEQGLNPTCSSKPRGAQEHERIDELVNRLVHTCFS